MNRLTSVPINIAPIIAIESGFCNSDPISKENNNGTIAKMVVSEVIIMGRNLRLPASWIASRSGIPVLRNSLIASSFKIESLIMIPHVTIKPIADIRFSVCPHIHSSTRANATSIGISSSTTSGYTKLSNCAARIKYINRIEINRMTTSSSNILRLEKKLPEKAVSQSPVASATSFTCCISGSAFCTS